MNSKWEIVKPSVRLRNRLVDTITKLLILDDANKKR